MKKYSDDRLYKQNFDNLLKTDLKNLKNLYYQDIRYHDLEEAPQDNNNVQLYLNTYSHIRRRMMQPYDEEKQQAYDTFIDVYEKIENVVFYNTMMLSKPDAEYNPPVSKQFSEEKTRALSLQSYCFDSINVRYPKHIVEDKENNVDEYISYVHYSQDILLELVFNFMYENKFAMIEENILSIIFFYNNFLFITAEKEEYVDDDVHECGIYEVLPFLELLYKMVEKKVNSSRTGFGFTSQVSPRKKFIAAINEYNECNFRYELHMRDIIDFFANPLAKENICDMPLYMLLDIVFPPDDNYGPYTKKYVYFKDGSFEENWDNYLQFGYFYKHQKSMDTREILYYPGYSFMLEEIKCFNS